MLHPKNNRIDYGDQLIPPDGYELTYAVGTSYSLDLEALMILPVALFYSQRLDGSTDDLRYDMLDAITKAAEKITVFYQNGQLKVPKKYHNLMAFWEDGIQPVTMPTFVSSFHPKVWVIRYESKEAAPRYRILITSRNLTFSRDWDMAYSTDGEVTDKDQSKNKPLVHFLQYLNTTGKKTIPNSFIADLLKVKFDLHEKFDEFKFIPIGIKNPETSKFYLNPLTSTKDNPTEILIVSPFLDKTTLNSIGKNSGKKRFLLSCKEELDGIDEDTLNNFDCWQFSSFFENAEFFQELEDDGPSSLSQNLHAKLFVEMNNKIPYWYLGSANCTDPAQARNVEFMVELKGGTSASLKAREVFKVLTDQAKSDGMALFTPYERSNEVTGDELKNVDSIVRKIKYELTQLHIMGEALQIEGGTAYNFLIKIDASNLTLPEQFEVRIKPLSEQQRSTVLITPGVLNTIDHFGGYPETTLSKFLIFEITHDDLVFSQFLLPMNIELPAIRLNKIFTSIIDSREKFMKYLTFLLSGEETESIVHAKKKSSDKGNKSSTFNGGPLYENLLIASSRFPEKLEAIDKLIQRLKEESKELKEPIVSAEFEGFWSIFQTFIKNKNS